MVGTMTCWTCGGIKRNTWKGYVCPTCKQIKAVNKQTKAIAGAQGGGGSNAGSSSGGISTILAFIFILPFNFVIFLVQSIITSYSKLFGAIYNEHLSIKSGEKNKAEGYTKIAFLSSGVVILTVIVIGLLAHGKK